MSTGSKLLGLGARKPQNKSTAVDHIKNAIQLHVGVNKQT